jgi:trehalose/maltose hydrolase-like predicted phosphorylase
MANTKPIGVAYEDQNIIGADTVNAGVVYATSQLGYTNAGYGTVTQQNNKATGVTINKTAGTITTANAQMAPGAKVAFVVTNSQVSALDTIIVNIASGATATFAYLIAVVTVTDGAFTINLDNVSSNAYTDTLKINFAVLHVLST